MEDKNKKCCFKEHRDKEANFYCIQCGVNFCNKCETFHSKFLENHKVFPLDKILDVIFTGFCKEKNHDNGILKFFASRIINYVVHPV